MKKHLFLAALQCVVLQLTFLFTICLVCKANGVESRENLIKADNAKGLPAETINFTPGAALDFDLGNSVTMNSFSFGTAWTVEGWINPSLTQVGWYALFSQCFWDANQGFAVIIESDLLRAESPQGLSISTPIDAITWTHVALSYGGGVFSLYKNGALAASQTVAFTNASNPFLLGVRTDNDGIGTTNFFKGKMDEVRVWNSTRNADQILSYMYCEIPAALPGLVASYHFNQGIAGGNNSGINTLTDNSGNGNTGTLSGFLLNGASSNWVEPGGVVSGNTCSPYCPAGVINTNGAQISNILFADINNTSTSMAGFENFTSITGNVQQNHSYPFTATLSNGYGSEIMVVWIDYNHDYDFTDPGEVVFGSDIGAGPYSGTITIPPSSTIGQTTMRIRVYDTEYNQFAFSCDNTIYGQVEDYTINIVAECQAPTATAATNLSSTSAKAHWTPTNGSFVVEWGPAGFTPGTGAVAGSGASQVASVSNVGVYTFAGLTPGITYQYYVRRNCSVVYSYNSGPISFTTYCAAAGAETCCEKIAFVFFNTISNSSSSNAGYENFTSITTSVEKGSAYSFNAGISNGHSLDRIIVWIDYNQDGDFTDGGEEAFNSPVGGPYSGSITIPLSATLGSTFMRVRLNYTGQGSNPTPCGYSGFGQVEDYMLNFLPQQVCTGTPAPGNTISSANPACQGANFTLSLQNATPGIGVTYQWKSSSDGTTYNDIAGATNSTLITSQTTNTYYKCNVTCSGNSTTSNPLFVTTNLCYCTAGSNSTDPGNGLKINQVIFANINNFNSSNWAGYENYTNITGTVQQNSSYTFTAFANSQFFHTNEVIVWIDFNKDGDFTDTGEKVLQTSGDDGFTGNFTIPSNSILSTTRMRVRLHYLPNGANATSCGNSTYGQVEDYTINITENCSAPAASAATNITTAGAQANWTPTTGSFIVEWGPTGFTPGTGASAGSGSSQVASVTNAGLYSMTGLTANTAYQYYVRRTCAGGYTTNSNAIPFTTLPQPNDAACNALLLSLGAGCSGNNLGNNTGATLQASEASPACYGSTVSNTVWYKFVAPASGSVRITTDNGSYTNTDTQIGLFAITNCANLSTATLLDCNEDGGMACTSCSVVNYSGLTSGNTYYVQVDGKNSMVGSFCITVDEVLTIATNANTCTDYTVSNVSGSNWISINADATQGSPIVAAINPNGLNLGTVTLSMRDITTVEQAPSGNWYLPRYYDWHCSGGPDCPASGNFGAAVSVRLFLEQAERTAYNTAKGGTPATVNDFSAIIYDGNNEDCNLSNNTTGTTTTVAATGMGVGSSLFYLQYNMAGFSEARVTSQTPSPGAALDFAYGNYIEAVSMPFGAAWTVEGWVNPSGTSGGWFSLFSQSYWNNNQGFAVIIENGLLRAESPQGLSVATSISANTWTHVALTYEHGVFSLSKNGSLAVSQPVAFTNASTPFLLGIRTDNDGSGLTDPYSGKMDEVRVWTRALGQCEILANMNCEAPATGTDLIANYHFNQGLAAEANTVSALADASGNGNNGILNGFLLAGATSNWAAPGGVGSGASCPAYLAPEIDAQGNGIAIVDGDNTPSVADHTDFGNATSRTFTIQNTGSIILNIGSVSVSGPGAPSFSVTTQPASSVPVGSSTTFVVTYLPSAGTHVATVTVNNTDCEEAVYDFAIQAEGVVLPVELASFTGRILENYNLLEWRTASEKNVQWHVIERAASGADNWQETGRLAGAGTAQGERNYQLQDPKPLPVSYYRLRTVDFDGSEQLSKVIVLERESDAFSLVNVFPVPTAREVNIQVSALEETEITIIITDVFGKVLSMSETTAQRGINNLLVDLAAMAPGVYLVQVGNVVSKVTGRLVKQ